jgi:gliding motility-associated lipoprotein GldD
MNNKSGYFIFSLLLLLLFACNAPYTSRKKGYYKIDLPEHAYRSFDKPEFPYSFDYPVYGNIIQDSTYFDSTPENNYWVNVDFPSFHARLFLSYKIVGGKAPYKIKNADGKYRDSVGINHFDLMVNDAFNLTNKNDVVASKISDSVIRTPNGISGIYFKVGGNAATARQFFLSDTLHHFIRGALYFESTPNADSIKPVLDFLTKDMDHLINTFKWKSPAAK